MDIDGSMGEGGGQILRTALALALITGTPIRVEKIRAGRRKPGLMRQHLVAVRAAAAIGAAKVSGDEVGSTALSFAPTDIIGGTHHFKIGSAGSTTLVLQTVLPALLRAREPSTLIVEGGTHNPLAPTFDFLERSFLPVLRRMGARVELALEVHGFHPAGGGRIVATVEPSTLVPLDLMQRGAVVSRGATAVISALPGDVAERELARVRERLGFAADECHIRGVKAPNGPGNVLSIAVESAHVTELVTAFGERGVRAEAVADRACDEVERYLKMEGVPVGEHLADQLLLPLALAGGGRFRALDASSHARTQVDLIPRFLDRIAIEVSGEGPAHFEVFARNP